MIKNSTFNKIVAISNKNNKKTSILKKVENYNQIKSLLLPKW